MEETALSSPSYLKRIVQRFAIPAIGYWKRLPASSAGRRGLSFVQMRREKHEDDNGWKSAHDAVGSASGPVPDASN